jgi:hypothetical protein
MENERSKEWVLERVQKLLNLGSNAGAEPGERDNAMRMAFNLLAKYNIEQSEAEAFGNAQHDPRGVLTREMYGAPWARVVANSMAKLFFCDVVTGMTGNRENTKMHFIGKHSNAVTAADLAVFLIGSIRKEAARRNRREGTSRDWIRSFSVAAASAIHYRVVEMVKDSKQEAAPGMALVLANVYTAEKAANQVVRSVKFPNLRRSGGIRGGRDSSGRASGAAYGKSVPLSRQVGGSTQRALT